MAKTYDTYKDSGIAWIGEIPGEWRVVRLKALTKEINEKNNPIKTNYVLSLTIKDGVIPYEKKGDIGNKSKDKHEEYKLAYPNTIVLNSMNILIGAVGICKYFGCVSPVYYVFKNNNKSDLHFLNYILSSTPFQKYLRKFANGILEIRLRISSNDIIKRHIPCPPLSVQQSISFFLDTKCGEIDSLISIQEEMISELLAYKQSVITEAVTKGLDKKAKMKNSGVEWIGDIPEEWEVQKLRTLGWCQNGISKSGDYFGEDYEYPFVSYPDAYKNFEVPYPKGRANSTLEDRQRYSLIKGDVLFTRTSETIEEIGFASTCTETIPNAVFSGFLIRFRPTSPKIYYGYSKYFFRSIIHRAFFVKEMNLVTRASLSQDLLKNLPVVLPKIEEQQAIATYLDEKTSQIDSLIALKQSKIESLKEYKKSIIYEYVTGKKRV